MASSGYTPGFLRLCPDEGVRIKPTAPMSLAGLPYVPIMVTEPDDSGDAAAMAKLCPGGNGMYVYCLFCTTDKCEYICRTAARRFGCEALSPKQIQHTWSRGNIRDIERNLLPGYVLLYFEEEYDEPQRFRELHGVIHLVCEKGGELYMQGRDEDFAMMLFRKKGILGWTPVYTEGQWLRIRKDAFAGLETHILKVDRRASRVQVEIPFAGRSVKTWLKYEMAETTEPEEKKTL